MPDETTADGAPAGGATKPSGKERRAEKRRLHEAQKKAKGIDKSNDKRFKAANWDEKKAQKNTDMAQKKTEKGKTNKAQKKVDKAARRRSRSRR